VDQILRTHLLSLESKLQELHDQLTSPATAPATIPRIKEEIQFRQDALKKLRRALELEQQFHERKSPAKTSPRANDTKAHKL